MSDPESDYCPDCLYLISSHFDSRTGAFYGCPAHSSALVATLKSRPEPVVIRIWRRGDRQGELFALLPEQGLDEGWVRGFTIREGWVPMQYAKESNGNVSRSARPHEYAGIVEKLGFEWPGPIRITTQWRPRGSAGAAGAADAGSGYMVSATTE